MEISSADTTLAQCCRALLPRYLGPAPPRAAVVVDDSSRKADSLPVAVSQNEYKRFKSVVSKGIGKLAKTMFVSGDIRTKGNQTKKREIELLIVKDNVKKQRNITK